MYMPKAFREDDPEALRTLMQQNSFATLVTHDQGALSASHLPFLFHSEEGTYGTLLSHMARANPQWRHFAAGDEALVIFQGPHTYVSPSWYEAELSVPTWNYAVVHAYGRPRLVEDYDEVYELLRQLVQNYEAPFPAPWDFTVLPQDYVRRMAQGIVAFTLTITRLEGKYKLSQNRPLSDRGRVIDALQQQGDVLVTDVATLMQQRQPTASQGD